jgi:hypothetical protein
MADYIEHTDLHSIKSSTCHICETPVTDVGQPGAVLGKCRDYEEYYRLLCICTNDYMSNDEFGEDGREEWRWGAETSLLESGVHLEEGVLWALGCVGLRTLIVLDMLHTIYLGLLKHVMEWVIPFLTQNEWIDKFNRLWREMPPYPGFEPFHKSYTSTQQWQGKEMRRVGRVLLPIFVGALHNPSRLQKERFDKAISCVKAFVNFHPMTQYQSHTEETIGYMKEYFDKSLCSKDVFARYRLSNSGKKTADEYRKKRAEYYRCTYVQLIQLLDEPIGMSSTHLIRRRGSNPEFKDLVLKTRKAYIENPDAPSWSVRLLLYTDGFWVPSNPLMGLSGLVQS